MPMTAYKTIIKEKIEHKMKIEPSALGALPQTPRFIAFVFRGEW